MKILRADDFEKDKLVTVYSHKKRKAAAYTEDGNVKTVTHRDSFGMGEVFKIASIDLPYLLLQSLTNRIGNAPCMLTLDIRRSKVAAVSREFAEGRVGSGTNLDEFFPPATIDMSEETT